MSKINVLHSTIFNRIAAGEVVDRPYSVVKELVENSIDAGATEITISIINGGIENITVSDNGSGILKEDLKKVYLPHATSKIATVDDLNNISTLGFRGEAMASIASVSRMTVISKSADSNSCYNLECNGGIIGAVNECSGDFGTTVIVNNLFFNTPVRAKFLKSKRSEQAEIANIVSRFILGNPNLSIKFVADNKIVFQSFGGGLEEAIIAVYGVEAINNTFKIGVVKNGIEISGYIGKHNYSKSNRSYQNLFINGRYVINNTVSSAIMNAYSSYLMKRQYPFFIIYLKIPYDVVDVNVHPNKTDVRFVNNQIVYSAIYSIISSVLDGRSFALEIVKNNNESTDNVKRSSYDTTNQFDKSDISNIKTMQDNIYSSLKKSNLDKIYTYNDNNKDDDRYMHDGKVVLPYVAREIEPFEVKVCDHTHIDANSKNEVDIFKENKEFLNDNKNIDLLHEATKFFHAGENRQDEFNFDEVKFIGQAFNTYLFYEIKDSLYIIDQHAAHERLLYDKYLKETGEGTLIKQGMLVPYILNVNYLEFQFIIDNSQVLANMGFNLEEFGNNSFKLSEIPAHLSDIDLKQFFNEFLGDINALDKKDSEFIKDKIAQSACKAAIKGGDIISTQDVEILFKQMKGNLGLKCPHGRPVATKITINELEKWFKRSI